MDHMQRPKMIVLSDAALVPDQNIASPPTKFTHEVVAEQPYYYERPKEGMPASGSFSAGTRLLLLPDECGPGFNKVVDGRGLSVLTPSEGLRLMQ